MVVTKQFVDESRQLAADFIAASDRFNALAAAWQHGGASEPDELTTPGEVVNLADMPILAGQLGDLYTTLGALLAPLKAADKKAIYALV